MSDSSAVFSLYLLIPFLYLSHQIPFLAPLKTSLQYLPVSKKTELEEIVKLITEHMQPAMIILFGSYARNTWAEEVTIEDDIRVEFKSDYDILVVPPVELNKQTNSTWARVLQLINNREYSTHVSLIQHSLGSINRELMAGSYFFSDLFREGVLLYHDGHSKLPDPDQVDPQAVRQRALEEFERWLENGDEFMTVFSLSMEKDLHKKAAFLLHQATESYFTAVLLVYTGYKGKLHDIEELSRKVSKLDNTFKQAFPKNTADERRRFDLLRRAYIDARYKKHFHIEKEDLDYLEQRVLVLRELVEQLCKRQLGLE